MNNVFYFSVLSIWSVKKSNNNNSDEKWAHIVRSIINLKEKIEMSREHEMGEVRKNRFSVKFHLINTNKFILKYLSKYIKHVHCNMLCFVNSFLVENFFLVFKILPILMNCRKMFVSCLYFSCFNHHKFLLKNQWYRLCLLPLQRRTFQTS